MYSIVLRAHLNIGHGERDKMLKEVNKKYANVTRNVLNLFKEMCEECQLKKRKNASKGLVQFYHTITSNLKKKNMFFSIEYLYMSLIELI
jgi:hypothetical protein